MGFDTIEINLVSISNKAELGSFPFDPVTQPPTHWPAGKVSIEKTTKKSYKTTLGLIQANLYTASKPIQDYFKFLNTNNLYNTKEQFMKGWSTPVGNVAIRQLQREILPNTKQHFIKRWSTLVGNVTIRQLQSLALPNTKGQFMKEWSTLVGNVTIK